MSEFYTILTTVGRNKLAAATANGSKVELTQMRLGDGNGASYNPTETQTSLRREVWRGNVTLTKVDPQNPNWIVVEVDVPATDGGFMIREAGIFDSDGTMIAISKYPETYKPLVSEGSAKELKVRTIIEVSNASSVTLNINPGVILVSQRELTETLDSAGFGENNLIRNSSEPFIINPAGNSNTANWVSPELEANTTYTFSANAEFLRGNSEAITIYLTREDPLQGISRLDVPVVDGKITRTVTTPDAIEGRPMILRISAGLWQQAVGNTLQLSNIMLTKSDRSQPYRPAHEDNTERLDAIETLKPITKRTVATFEGKVSGSDVENPHNATSSVWSSELMHPTTGGASFSNNDYSAISTISNASRIFSNNTANSMAQTRYVFNIIKHLEKENSVTIWQGHTTLADKVRIARQIVKRIAFVWDGHGKTNDNFGVWLIPAFNLSLWDTDSFRHVTHTNSISQRLTCATNNSAQVNQFILNDGTCRFLVHTAEGQTTPIGGASLTTEFVQFEVDVETTLASTDWSYSKAEIDALKPTTAPLPLATTPQIGSSGQFADAAHVHQMPTANQVGALTRSDLKGVDFLRALGHDARDTWTMIAEVRYPKNGSEETMTLLVSGLSNLGHPGCAGLDFLSINTRDDGRAGLHVHNLAQIPDRHANWGYVRTGTHVQVWVHHRDYGQVMGVICLSSEGVENRFGILEDRRTTAPTGLISVNPVTSFSAFHEREVVDKLAEENKLLKTRLAKLETLVEQIKEKSE